MQTSNQFKAWATGWRCVLVDIALVAGFGGLAAGVYLLFRLTWRS